MKISQVDSLNLKKKKEGEGPHKEKEIQILLRNINMFFPPVEM